MPKRIIGLAAPLPLANVDTDVIMPKRFLITITREGLADGTFADLRFDDAGEVRPAFILNQKPWTAATILVVGDNFGCGSSREHAVWGLNQLGITAVIGTGFAGIFYDNARKNGLALPIVTSDERDRLLALAQQGIEVTVDIENRVIMAGEFSAFFQMDSATKTALVEGRDDITDSLKYSMVISGYEEMLGSRMKVQVAK